MSFFQPNQESGNWMSAWVEPASRLGDHLSLGILGEKKEGRSVDHTQTARLS